MNNKYDSDYEIRLATLEAMGGDVSKRYDSVYEIDLEILRLTEEGGGGGLTEPFYTDTTSSFDQLGITEQKEDKYANIALSIYKYQSGLSPSLQLTQDDNDATLEVESLAFNTTDTTTAYGNDGIYYGSEETGELFIPIKKLAKIDDDTTSTQTVWSSQKTKEEIDNAGGIKLPDNVSITEEAISIFSDLGVTTSLYPDHVAIMGGEGLQLRSDGDVWYFIGDDVVKGRNLKDYLFSSPGKIIKLTQEEYDALEEKEETTLYIIK